MGKAGEERTQCGHNLKEVPCGQNGAISRGWGEGRAGMKTELFQQKLGGMGFIRGLTETRLCWGATGHRGNEETAAAIRPENMAPGLVEMGKCGQDQDSFNRGEGWNLVLDGK